MEQANIKLDSIDLAILREIQADSRISNSELARRITLSQPATHARLKRLESSGLIRHYTALLNPEMLGLDMLCFVHIRLQAHSEDALQKFQTAIEAMPEVLECHHLTGQFDYVLKILVKNRRALEQFLRHRLVTRADISQISTSIVLKEVKSTTKLPLEEEADE